MKYIEDKLNKLGGSDYKYKHLKGDTVVSYKMNGKKHKLTLEGGQVAIAVHKIKEEYQPKFKEHTENINKVCQELDNKFKPTLEQFKLETKEATEKELLRQLDKHLNR